MVANTARRVLPVGVSIVLGCALLAPVAGAASTDAPARPSAPATATVGPVNGAARLSWLPPRRTGRSPISSYVVTPFVNGRRLPSHVFSASSTRRIVRGLTNGVAYTFTVAARNASGTGPASAATSPVVVGAPTRPVRAIASGGDGRAVVTWRAPASSNGAPITGYVVIALRGWVTVGRSSFAGGATHHVVDGLSNGKPYRFRVRARNTRGLGPWSQGATNAVVPRAVGDGPPPPGGYFKILPPGSALPSGASCAARVHRSTWEPRPGNYTANHTQPKNPAALAYFSQWSKQWNSTYRPRITGGFEGTTDEIFQWAACKWGWSDDLVRAEAVTESHWDQSTVGDGATSYSVLQIRYLYHPDVNGTRCKACAGSSWPNSQRSTAYAVDQFAAEMRGCYDGMSTYLGNTRGDLWGCIQQWYSGEWTPGGGSYAVGSSWSGGSVKRNFIEKPWLGWSG